MINNGVTCPQLTGATSFNQIKANHDYQNSMKFKDNKIAYNAYRTV